MSPNDVKELLDASIAELGLPLVISNGGPQLVVSRPPMGSIEKKQGFIKYWISG